MRRPDSRPCRTRVAGRLAAALLVLTAAGCTARPRSQGAVPEDAFAGHVIHGDQLRATMQQLDTLRSARLPQELDRDRVGVFQPGDAAHTAAQIAESAARIANSAPLAELSPEQRRDFLDLADALREQAAALAADAPSLTTAALRARYAELDASCDTCHQRFRLPRSPSFRAR